MATLKRIYVYLVAFISLGTVSFGLASLVNVILDPLLGGPDSVSLNSVGSSYYRENVAFYAAILIIGLPVWAGHWIAAQRWLRPDASAPDVERNATLRKLYLYVVLGVAMLTALYAASEVVTSALDLVLRQRDAFLTYLTNSVVQLLVALGIWYYHWRVVTADRLATPERGGGATLRRWYFYGVTFVGLITLANGATLLTAALWQEWVASGTGLALREVIAQRVGLALAGLGVWLWHYRWTSTVETDDAARTTEDRWNHSAIAGQSGPPGASAIEGRGAGAVGSELRRATVVDDRRSTLRKAYLFGAVALATTATLYYVSQGFYELALAALGIERIAGEPSLVLAVGRAVAGAAVFGALWTLHWQAIQIEAAVQPEVSRQASVRRLYTYLVALVGEAMLIVAAASMLRLLIDVGDHVVNGLYARSGTDWWQEQLALNLTLLVVGLPVWLFHWIRLQRLANRDDAAGVAERRSLFRRMYLYIGVLAGVLTMLFHGSVVLYALLNRALGGSPVGDVPDFFKALSDCLVLGLVLLYCWRTLRADAAWGEHDEAVSTHLAPAPANGGGPGVALAVISGADRRAIEGALAELQRALPASARVEVRWTDSAGAEVALHSPAASP
ncbi:MAG: hypothetical protein HY329_05920 [Chloroflexi bacterium]|nr:hypothetical protein [Chloroflexota bacterium]